jgi:hypothetical protein
LGFPSQLRANNMFLTETIMVLLSLLVALTYPGFCSLWLSPCNMRSDASQTEENSLSSS